jgi:hypothetical protein
LPIEIISVSIVRRHSTVEDMPLDDESGNVSMINVQVRPIVYRFETRLDGGERIHERHLMADQIGKFR